MDIWDGRLHDARHTAGTILLLLGVPKRMAMDIMGWSSTAISHRYQHVTARTRAGRGDADRRPHLEGGSGLDWLGEVHPW
ncbi:tyrosine-type recombinase/integrase [Kitasatospora sp. NPDC005748]|uniref:tyrosine-type recombinase/integrase n=1 Tax=Kitasatospora sp. NPDC005748 TaxID=3157063 RepID=UPI00340689FB